MQMIKHLVINEYVMPTIATDANNIVEVDIETSEVIQQAYKEGFYINAKDFSVVEGNEEIVLKISEGLAKDEYSKSKMKNIESKPNINDFKIKFEEAKEKAEKRKKLELEEVKASEKFKASQKVKIEKT